MMLKPIYGLSVVLALAAAAPSAAAADWGSALRRGDLGSPSQAAAQKTVKITAATQYITVEHFQTLKIENDKGQSFVWRFDSFGEVGFPLEVIAPKGVAACETRVYIRHPAAHVSG